MNCESYFDLISGHVDGQNTPEEEAALQAHLSACAACRATMDAMTSLNEDLVSLREDVPPRVKENVMKTVKQEASGKKRSRWLAPGAAIGAVAAVLVLMLGTGVIKLPECIGSDVANKACVEQLELSTEPMLAALPNAAEDGAERYGADDYDTVPAEFLEDNQIVTGAIEETQPAADATKQNGAAEQPGEATPAATEHRGPGQTTALTADDETFCAELSQTMTAPVLVYCGLDESFPAQLIEMEPAFEDVLKDVRLRQVGTRWVMDTDVETLATIHKWLTTNLPELGYTKRLTESTDPDELQIISREEMKDWDLGTIKTVITIEQRRAGIIWPELWPTDFAERFRSEENWQFFYPSTDYVPTQGDLACLVLIPAAE